ncbi:MAG: hypothetical protein UU09_C0045G0009 [Microgenomates group bacterium GW2011_GWA2_40_6]|nr:MAG: hypothetical protein UU09_C0045G0009 [Microgenomates group bacterium GW2011_GWA2_40_6]
MTVLKGEVVILLRNMKSMSERKTALLINVPDNV